MHTHDQLVKKLMRRPGVRAEVARIEREETALLDALLKARQEAGLTQGHVTARMGTHAPTGERKALPIDCDAAQICQGLWQAPGAQGRMSAPEPIIERVATGTHAQIALLIGSLHVVLHRTGPTSWQ